MPFTTYHQDQMGTAVVDSAQPRVAGELDSFTITYTAGTYGIDDSGMIKFSWRTTSDMEKPQFDRPQDRGFTTVEASNGATLECWIDRSNIRPWTNSLIVRVNRGYLRKGDTITVRFGDTRQGSPGIRQQTNAESKFTIKVFVDAFATYEFAELDNPPGFQLIPGKPAAWRAIVPSRVAPGAPFNLSLVTLDRWGNPTEAGDTGAVTLATTADGASLPGPQVLDPKAMVNTIGPVSVAQAGDAWFTVTDAEGNALCTSNPLRVDDAPQLSRFWGDLHGQSGETVGTNPAHEYFHFARDLALIDIAGHQGNDFQIDDPFWEQLNAITAEYNEPGRFLAIPGYEWSGNTGLGGDRNVFYRQEGRPIHRSSHILIDEAKAETVPCPTAHDLFRALDGEDAVVIAHVGGRYADIRYAHDTRLETSVEIHSSWGTFEWLLHDALDEGYRVGVICHSDDHKGRLGATSPGASSFGAIGGLTCYLMPELTRDSLFDCLRRRHHYGTTGPRIFMDVQGHFDEPATIYLQDPESPEAQTTTAGDVLMGDIVAAAGQAMRLDIDALGTAPISEVVVFNGTQRLETFRPGTAPDSRRIAIRWAGAEYRGRGRETIWKGQVRVEGNSIRQAHGVNFLNPDRKLQEVEPDRAYGWTSVTTGNISGVDVVLEKADAGKLVVDTNLGTITLDLATLGGAPVTQDAGGLERKLWVERLPEDGCPRAFRASCSIEPGAAESAIYVRVTQEDGNQAWSSPIYLLAGS